MSHYVVAWLPEGRMPLNNGMPIGTLMGLDHSGFSVYGEYDAIDLHAGVSGNGEAKTVDRELARKAYVRSLGWAMAFKQAFPEEFKKSFPRHEDILNVAPYGDIQVQADAICDWMSILKQWEKSTPPGLESVLPLIEGVLRFTKAVFVASEKGPVAIHFS